MKTIPIWVDNIEYFHIDVIKNAFFEMYELDTDEYHDLCNSLDHHEANKLYEKHRDKAWDDFHKLLVQENKHK